MTTLAYPYKPRPTNARIAGLMFLLYIGLGIAGMILFDEATNAPSSGSQLANIAQHVTDVRVSIVLALFSAFVAMVLSTALYAITREQDRFLAMLAMTSLFGAAVIEAIYIPTTLGLLALATTGGGNTADAAAINALGTFLLTARAWNPLIAATFFAVGSTLYSWLLLRGRMIPVALAALGVLASVLWVVGLPLQLLGLMPDTVAWGIYVPMAAFQISVGLWLVFKGITLSSARRVAAVAAD